MNSKSDNFNKHTDAMSATKEQALFRDIKDVLVILALFMVVYILFFRVVIVVGDSMNKTLLDGDKLLLISNTLYTQPKRGDVIVASKDSFRNGECIVKRVIATEGEWVRIDFEKGIVEVSSDGMQTWQVLDEPYISTPTTDQEGMHFPLLVEEGCVFVMGDNRGDSQDSRSPAIGLIDRREILGKAFFLVFPGNDHGNAELDFSRIGGID